MMCLNYQTKIGVQIIKYRAKSAVRMAVRILRDDGMPLFIGPERYHRKKNDRSFVLLGGCCPAFSSLALVSGGFILAAVVRAGIPPPAGMLTNEDPMSDAQANNLFSVSTVDCLAALVRSGCGAALGTLFCVVMLGNGVDACASLDLTEAERFRNLAGQLVCMRLLASCRSVHQGSAHVHLGSFAAVPGVTATLSALFCTSEALAVCLWGRTYEGEWDHRSRSTILCETLHSMIRSHVAQPTVRQVADIMSSLNRARVESDWIVPKRAATVGKSSEDVSGGGVGRAATQSSSVALPPSMFASVGQEAVEAVQSFAKTFLGSDGLGPDALLNLADTSGCRDCELDEDMERDVMATDGQPSLDSRPSDDEERVGEDLVIDAGGLPELVIPSDAAHALPDVAAEHNWAADLKAACASGSVEAAVDVLVACRRRCGGELGAWAKDRPRGDRPLPPVHSAMFAARAASCDLRRETDASKRRKIGRYALHTSIGGHGASGNPPGEDSYSAGGVAIVAVPSTGSTSSRSGPAQDVIRPFRIVGVFVKSRHGNVPVAGAQAPSRLHGFVLEPAGNRRYTASRGAVVCAGNIIAPVSAGAMSNYDALMEEVVVSRTVYREYLAKSASETIIKKLHKSS